MPKPRLQERLLTLIQPAYLLLLPAATSFLTSAFKLFILKGNFPSLSNVRLARDDGFAAFWTKATAPIDPPPPPQGSATLIPPVVSRAHGDVLDIGPGSGTNVFLFSDNANITAIYGAEPTVGLHAPLKDRINDAKLTDKYHILASSADKTELLVALSKEGIKPSPKGNFDTIVCIRVLCSVPNLEEVCRELYSLLRPGGDLIVVEHIKNPWTKNGSILARFMQILYTVFGWTFFLAGCDLNRDTGSALRKAGAWEAVDLKTDFEWSPLAYVSGTLTKAR